MTLSLKINLLATESHTMTDKFDLYQHVTDRLIELMEREGANWTKPWRAVAGEQPHNAVSKRTYKGVNPGLLHLEGRACPAWASFKQWQSKGYNVQKGERSTLVVFWKMLAVKDKDDDKARTIPMLKYYRVFNGEQVADADGKPYAFARPELTETIDRHAEADAAVAASGAKINHVTGDRAFYSPLRDEITMPHAGQFAAAAGYYGTLLHELGHWTGHASRLDRDFSGRFGSQAYAFEELVAESTAAFLASRLGIEADPAPDHAQYLNSWLRVLRDDKKAIFTAFSAARKAADLICPEADDAADADEKNAA
jgi:antirestriction protein ArdC